MKPRRLELLSPAANAEIATQAILHGADAVYIGPPSHGARKSAANSIEDIERLVDFAHQYRARVYATVNTIIYDEEIPEVERLCWRLYHAGVDALIIQDMGILRMNLPPIALHASTQCDIRTPEKAKFLEEIGFSQLVLARELTLAEIKEISEAVSIPVETFVHGALCVSYSGRCHASFALNGRSANRGECAQICRYPFTLVDSNGKVYAKDKYLLSLKDFNASHNLENLIEAGVSSFKIEGRLKDMSYVKNITSLYHNQLDSIISENPDKYCRSSYGKINLKFTPKADKSFNRGFTSYFLEERKPKKIVSLLSPKSQGEKINNISELNNGDGISFYDREGNFTGVNINRIEGNRIIPARNIQIPPLSRLYRTSDIKWEKLLSNDTATRKIPLEVSMDNNGVSATDSRGVRVRLPLTLEFEKANKAPDYKAVFEKLGNTPYFLQDFKSKIDTSRFYRLSELSAFRRELFRLLDTANRATYPFEYRKKENVNVKYPDDKLDYRDNVANNRAKDFYLSHGIKEIQPALETNKKQIKDTVVMTTRHCILRELGMCRKDPGNKNKISYPLFLRYKGGEFELDFDCNACEMKVIKR
ncbi:MAG: U32 family peptidase [Muribaculaceae bacterium]|nr:U32 family peptidase [Muribaculaceae bacterium]